MNYADKAQIHKISSEVEIAIKQFTIYIFLFLFRHSPQSVTSKSSYLLHAWIFPNTNLV